MIINRLLVIGLPWLLVSTLISCQTLKKVNRKPQLAGFRGYCSNCLLKDLDKDVHQLRGAIKQSHPSVVHNQGDETFISVRSAVVFDKEGKSVCHIDLLKHTQLVPSFAKLSANKIVHRVANNKFQRRLASVEEKSTLPTCTTQYLGLLKRTAKHGMIVDGDKSPIHKVNIGPDVVINCQKTINELHLQRLEIISMGSEVSNKAVAAGIAGITDQVDGRLVFPVRVTCGLMTGIIVAYYENIMRMDKNYVLTGAQRDELHAKLGRIKSEQQREQLRFNKEAQKLKSKIKSKMPQLKYE